MHSCIQKRKTPAHSQVVQRTQSSLLYTVKIYQDAENSFPSQKLAEKVKNLYFENFQFLVSIFSTQLNSYHNFFILYFGLEELFKWVKFRVHFANFHLTDNVNLSQHS